LSLAFHHYFSRFCFILRIYFYALTESSSDVTPYRAGEHELKSRQRFNYTHNAHNNRDNQRRGGHGGCKLACLRMAGTVQVNADMRVSELLALCPFFAEIPSLQNINSEQLRAVHNSRPLVDKTKTLVVRVCARVRTTIWL
jgi:hypothetical protein